MTTHDKYGFPLEAGPAPGKRLDVPIVITVPVWMCLACGARGDGRGWNVEHAASGCALQTPGEENTR